MRWRRQLPRHGVRGHDELRRPSRLDQSGPDELGGGPAQSEAKAGRVTFWAVHDMDHAHGGNEGGATHDLQVMRKGTGGNLELVGQVQGLTMGQAKALTLNLTPGDYELSCNVVEQIAGKMVSHYQQGMVTAFKVTA